jgi:hypothetical protein
MSVEASRSTTPYNQFEIRTEEGKFYMELSFKSEQSKTDFLKLIPDYEVVPLDALKCRIIISVNNLVTPLFKLFQRCPSVERDCDKIMKQIKV